MQLNIAICDDREEDCHILESILRDVCTNLSLKVQITLFYCGEDLLESHQKKAYDIIFIDIYLPGISGIDTMKSACQVHSCQFVFTTFSREHALEAFDLNAVHYLSKPLTKESVNEAMERCLTRLDPYLFRYLAIKTKQGIVPIPMNDIVYIEVINKICTIHTNKCKFQTYSSLSGLFHRLDETTFIRAQQSFIVNMHFIDSFYFDHIVLKDGTKIVLSRNNRTKLKKQYQQFLFQSARRKDLRL